MRVAQPANHDAIERLRAWDVKHIFDYPGDGINGILAAFGRGRTWDQFKAATTAVLAGDEDRVGFIRAGPKTEVQEFMLHKKS